MADTKITEPTEILLAFIDDEDKALEKLEQGSFYCYNHYEIKALIPRAPRLLDDEQLFMFYFHLLRNDVLPAVKKEEDFEVLRLAYQPVTNLLGSDYTLCGLGRAQGILLFGHDGKWALANEEPLTLEAYLKYRKVWAHVNNYVSIPGMLEKKARFLPYGEDILLVMRIMKVLRGQRYTEAENLRVTQLWFWGLVFIALLHPPSARVVVEDLTTLFDGSGDWIDRLEILRRYLVVAGYPDLVEKTDLKLATATGSRPELA
ncbi:hypothetical protein SAMN05428959_101227 [Duganella sp. CF517]|uniref:hypothetical protein n=1 Tax=Duganella sp. CF517 TaxID=1881038 RepID=UPI0008D501F1|nr:hypothetical protein [Duganella sp. CF517]SEN10825.1 hypothetical protein SAMN05428959_101227 [Duganella sp. CF517]